MSTATEKGSPIRVLVVDDHRIFAEALAIAVGLARGMTANVATSGPEAIDAALRLHPDVVLMDLEMPGMDGLATTRQLRASYPPARVVVVSGHEDDVAKAHAYEAGAVGFVAKHSAVSEIIAVIRQACHGDPLIDDRESIRLTRILRHRRHLDSTQRQRVSRLTPRQLEILQLVADGIPSTEIAERLGVSLLTLRTHLQNILTRLGVHTKLEAVALAIKHERISVREVGQRPLDDE